MKKLLVIFLCLAMMLSVFVACKKDDTKEEEKDPVQSEIDALIEVASQKLKNEPYREVEKKTKSYTATLAGGYTTSDTDVETLVYHWDGYNMESFAGESDTEAYMIYYDGMIYSPFDNKKIALSAEEVEMAFAAGGFDDEWFNSFKYKDISVTKNEDGTTTVLGKGADESAQEFISGALGSVGSSMGMKMEANYEECNLRWSLTQKDI